MTKTILSSLLLMLIGIGLNACSTNNSGASDPNKTSEEFDHPTGTVTSTNAKAISNAGIQGNSVILFNDPSGIFTLGTPGSTQALTTLNYKDCTTKNGEASTIDWECVFRDATACSATGETVTTNNADNEFTTVDYNEFKIACNASDPAEDVSISCDGQINIARSDDLVFCADMSCEIDGVAKEFNGCRNKTGYFLARLSGKSFTIRSMEITDTCTKLTTIVRDKVKTKTITCDIAEADVACSGISSIQKITNCTLN